MIVPASIGRAVSASTSSFSNAVSSRSAISILPRAPGRALSLRAARRRECCAEDVRPRALVMGAGPIGLMLGRVLKSRGIAQTTTSSASTRRRNYAAKEAWARCSPVWRVPENTTSACSDATGVGMLVSATANRFVRARGRC